MRDLDRALADIVAIRSQLARDETFRGLGAATVAATGIVALMVAGAQALWLGDPNARPLLFFTIWVGAALVAFALVGVETVRRSRRIHSGLADAMIWNAIEVFLPTAGAGACLGLVIGRFAPEAAWMLPGLWQVLTGSACSPRRASCRAACRAWRPGTCSPASAVWRSRAPRTPSRPG